MSTKKRKLPACPNCNGRLANHGAEADGDGAIYDVLSCNKCGPVYHWHATYCECAGCKGNASPRCENIYDPHAIE